MGLYAGNWEYVTDEEKVPEYLSVAEKIADVEGRTTRRAYAKLTSNESPRDTENLIRSSFRNQLRKSGRARNAVDYARLSTTEGNSFDATEREQSQQSDGSPAQAENQASPTSASSISETSMLMPNAASRSTFTSTATKTEQFERPKQSWNAIVYEVLATADGPLTFTQLMQGIRKLYPFFKSPSQEKVLKSGLKNPLYFHEAFIKGDIINGKQTWGLKPGEFIDKKTGELLTPQPRNPIRSPKSSPQVLEVEEPSSVEVTPKVSNSHRPRTSNPRFGREILNSPEIPDSQDPIPTPSSPQGAVSRVAAEHRLRLEEPTGTQKAANAEQDTLPPASPEVGVSVRASPPRSQWPATVGSPAKSTSNGRVPIAAAVEDKGIRKIIGPIDHEISAKSMQSFKALQAVQPRTVSIPSSIEGSENHNGLAATFQVASTPIPQTASPKHAPARSADGAARSQTPETIPATLTTSVTYLPDTQLYVILYPLWYPCLNVRLALTNGSCSGSHLPDGKAAAKENTFVHMPRWA